MISLNVFSNLLFLLLPFIFGYFLKLSTHRWQLVVGNLLNGLVYLILFLMGINLTLHDNLVSNLKLVVDYTLVFFFCITLANTFALILLNRYLIWHISFNQHHDQSRFKMLFSSLPLFIAVLLGALIGLSHLPILYYSAQVSDLALSLLLFLVGIQLRASGMPISQILINKNGIIIALTVLFSALLGGCIAATIVNLPIKTGLALSSGFGWYSLSGSLLTKAFGVTIGTTAFLNDLARELLALIFIPILIRYNPALGLGLSGATSMDFTLPILQHSAGSSIFPLAIVHGFILSLLAPLLMSVFS